MSDNQEDSTRVKEIFKDMKKEKAVFRFKRFKIVRFVAEILLPSIYFLFAIISNADYKHEYF